MKPLQQVIALTKKSASGTALPDGRWLRPLPTLLAILVLTACGGDGVAPPVVDNDSEAQGTLQDFLLEATTSEAGVPGFCASVDIQNTGSRSVRYGIELWQTAGPSIATELPVRLFSASRSQLIPAQGIDTWSHFYCDEGELFTGTDSFSYRIDLFDADAGTTEGILHSLSQSLDR
jgi:hypothetical protein